MAEQDLTAVLKLRDEMSAAMSKPMKALKALETSFNTVKAGAQKAMLVMTGVATLLGKSALHAADELDRLSKQTGVSVENLQKLGMSAKASGSDLNDLALAMRNLSRMALEAANGSQEARDAFRDVGIAVKDQNGQIRSAEVLFNDFADAIAKTENPTERMAKATQLLGRNGSSLIPMLSQGSAGMKAVGEAAAKAGFIMSKETVDSLDKFGDQLELVKDIFTNVMGTFLVQTGITVPKMVTAFIDFSVVINTWAAHLQVSLAQIIESFKWWEKTIRVTLDGVGNMFTALVVKAYQTFKPLGDVLMGFVALNPLLSDAQKEAAAKYVGTLVQLEDGTKSFGQAVEDTLDGVAQASEDFQKNTQTTRDKIYADLEKDIANMKKFGDDINNVISKVDSNAKKTGGSADKAAAMAAKLRNEIKEFERSTGIKLTEEQTELLRQEFEKADGDVKKLFETIRKETEGNPFAGFKLAMKDLSEETYNFRNAWTDVFHTMRDGMSDAMAHMIADGDNFNDTMKKVFKDIKFQFIKMMTDMVTSNLFKQLAGQMGGSAGAGGVGGGSTGGGGLGSLLGNNSVATVDPRFAGSGSTSTAAASANNFTQTGQSGITGAFGGGLGGTGGVLGMGGMLGLGVMQQQASQGNIAGSALGGLAGGGMLGLSIGGPIGGIVGGVAGLGLGLYQGIQGKDDADKAKEEANSQAAAQKAAIDKAKKQLLAQKRAAASQLQKNLYTNYSGGLATPEAAGAVGDLLKGGGVSVQDLDDYMAGKYPALTGGGSPQLAGVPGGEESALGANSGGVSVNNPQIVINATISSSYDVNKLGQDIVSAMQNASAQSTTVSTP